MSSSGFSFFVFFHGTMIYNYNYKVKEIEEKGDAGGDLRQLDFLIMDCLKSILKIVYHHNQLFVFCY